MNKLSVVVAACAALVCIGAVAAETAQKAKPTAVRKLGKDDAAVFVRLTVQRSARFDELTVFQRVLREKQVEFREVQGELEKKFGLDPKKSYSYDAATHKLFELVPAKKKGADPEKKEVKSFKSAEEANPLARAMVSRRLVENQLEVLGQLSREKAQEADLVDAKIRKMFSLDADGIYSFNADDSTIYKTGTRAKAAKDK